MLAATRSAAVSRLSFPLSLYWVFKWRPPTRLSTRTLEQRPLKATVSESTVSRLSQKLTVVSNCYIVSAFKLRWHQQLRELCASPPSHKGIMSSMWTGRHQASWECKRDSCAHEAEQQKENCNFEGVFTPSGLTTKTTSRNEFAKRFAVTIMSWTMGF